MGEDLVDWACDKHGRIHLNSFWGGEGYGRCVQFTIGRDYAQMSFDEARTFLREAIRLIDAREEGYNENPPWWEQLQSSDTTVKAEDSE